MQKFSSSLLLSLLILLQLSCSKEDSSFSHLIENVQVIDVQNGTVSSDMFVAYSGDTIQLVAPMKERAAYTARHITDAEGRYLMPGLWDMHVHFRGGDSLTGENKALLPMFLDHGITTVRDAGGDMTPAVLNWKNKINEGVLDGPDIFTSGPKLDGAEPAWPGSLKTSSAEEVSAALDSLEALGTDYVKIYDGSLEEEVYYEIIRQCETRGLKVTGHMPMDADLMKAVNLGLDGIEHLYYLLGVSSPAGDSIRQQHRGYGSLPALIDSYNREQAIRSLEKLSSGKFYATPTMHIGEVLKDLKTADHSNDRLLERIGPGIQSSYARRENSARRRSEIQQEYTEKRFDLFMELIPLMQEAGIILLAGSDCGASNSYVYPGASLQEELIMLTRAGLSPQQALATSVINGPEFFGLSRYYCKIEKGRIAHMILLENNPLLNIDNIKSIDQVIKGAEIYRIRE